MRRGVLASLAIVCGVVLGCTSTYGLRTTQSGGEVSADAASFQDAMRELWAEHVIWTRSYIVAAAANDPSAAATATRLLRNQEQLGAAIAPYFGADAGARLTSLLKEHITIAVDLVAAAKAGDNAKVTSADARWRDNAAQIATFLSGANPTNWPRATLIAMLNEHLTLTTQEATARIQKRWEDDIAAFDKIFDQAMHMADALSAGIIKQFPARF